MSKELKYETAIKTPYGDEVVKVNYKWTPYFCTHCQKVGHFVSACKSKKATTAGNTNGKMKWVPKPKQNPPVPENQDEATVEEKEAPAYEKQPDKPVAPISDTLDDNVETNRTCKDMCSMNDGFVSPKRNKTRNGSYSSPQKKVQYHCEHLHTQGSTIVHRLS